MLKAETIELLEKCSQGILDTPWKDFKDFLTVGDVELFEHGLDGVHRVRLGSLLLCFFFISLISPSICRFSHLS